MRKNILSLFIEFIKFNQQYILVFIRYYSEAYSNLLEVRLSDTNEFEVKTVAGYIDYKVCRVLFCQNKPRDAISHFKAHIEHYKQKRGHAHLLFQHFAWLSKQ